MESLSPKQVSEIKDLYASVYKVKEEVEEATGTPSSLEEEVDAFEGGMDMFGGGGGGDY